MRWPGIETLYGPTLRQSAAFATGSASIDGKGEKRWTALHDRIIEHVSLLTCRAIRVGTFRADMCTCDSLYRTFV